MVIAITANYRLELAGVNARCRYSEGYEKNVVLYFREAREPSALSPRCVWAAYDTLSQHHPIEEHSR
jgi:hypothetical protein